MPPLSTTDEESPRRHRDRDGRRCRPFRQSPRPRRRGARRHRSGCLLVGPPGDGLVAVRQDGVAVGGAVDCPDRPNKRCHRGTSRRRRHIPCREAECRLRSRRKKWSAHPPSRRSFHRRNHTHSARRPTRHSPRKPRRRTRRSHVRPSRRSTRCPRPPRQHIRFRPRRLVEVGGPARIDGLDAARGDQSFVGEPVDVLVAAGG